MVRWLHESFYGRIAVTFHILTPLLHTTPHVAVTRSFEMHYYNHRLISR